MAVTWANIKTMVYANIGDTEANSTFFSVDQILKWAHESLRELGERTHLYDLQYAQQGLADDPYISFGNNMFQIWRVEVDDIAMRPSTVDGIRRRDRFWESRTGTPRVYMLDEYQTVLDTYKIRLFETPSADYEFTLFGYASLALPSTGSPTLNVHLPEWFAYCLVHGILQRAYLADTPMMSQEIAAFHAMVFDDAVMRLRVRSFGRLKNELEYQPESAPRTLSIWDRIPSTITGP